MSCNNGFFGGNCNNGLWTIIIIVFLLSWLGGGSWGCSGGVCNNGCGNGCGDCGC